MSTVVIIVVVGLATAVAVAVFAFASRWRDGHIERVFGGREEIEVEAAISRRFTTENLDLDAAAELWKTIADCYSVRPGQLQLTDRFGVELGGDSFFRFDDELSCVNRALEDFFAKHGLDVDLPELKTVEDCIVALRAESRRGQQL